MYNYRPRVALMADEYSAALESANRVLRIAIHNFRRFPPESYDRGTLCDVVKLLTTAVCGKSQKRKLESLRQATSRLESISQVRRAIAFPDADLMSQLAAPAGAAEPAPVQKKRTRRVVWVCAWCGVALLLYIFFKSFVLSLLSWLASLSFLPFMAGPIKHKDVDSQRDQLSKRGCADEQDLRRMTGELADCSDIWSMLEDDTRNVLRGQ